MTTADIEKAFAFLHENIPQWFSNVAEIERKIIAMQSELARIPMSRSLPLKKRTGSMESIRDQDLDAIREDATVRAAAEHRSQPMPRKRKESSMLSGHQSGHQSGPSKLRSRTMIVVQYDGQIQSAFEQLVRSIGTGRNMLRKGKMAARIDAMAALAGGDDDAESDDNDDLMAKLGYRHRSGRMPTRPGILRMPESNSNTRAERFDTADKALENAQALCERGAHQSLREGDCRKELASVREHFEEVKGVAKDEVARYAVQKLVAKEKGRWEPPKLEKRTPAPVPVIEKGPLAPFTAPPVPVTSTQNASNEGSSHVIDIEIDDAEDSDDLDFVMPPIRLTSRV